VLLRDNVSSSPAGIADGVKLDGTGMFDFGDSRMSFKSMTGSRVGGGMRPSFCAANAAMLLVFVAELTLRAATGVVVKNGWANRNGVTFPPRGLPAFDETAFLAI